MKTNRAFVLLMLAALVAAACAPATDPSPTAVPSTPVPPTEVPPTVTPTEIPPTLPPPTPTANPTFFRDDFEGALGEGWLWLGEDPTRWNLTDAPGSLRIIVQGCNIASDGQPRNFLVRPIPEGDFQIETFLKFEPTDNFQFAGLLIYEAQGKAMQFGRAFAKCDFPAWKGNAIYFDLADPSATNQPNFATPMNETSQAYLRLLREGNQYSGFYSADGVNWMLIGTHTSGIAPVYIGLIASQGFQAEAPADFDYFEVSLP